VRRAFALAACVLAAGCGSSPSRAARHPSVLLVIFDDLTADIDLYGGAARTPSLDRLAARGRRFDRAYCQYPLCNPSRTSLFTGWRPERTGVWGNLRNPAPWVRDAVMLQDHFARNGYYTARVGKVNHSRFENEFHWSEVVDTYGSAAGEEEGVEWGEWHGDEADLPDVVAARNAVRILTAPRAQPVFLALGLLKPHAPWVLPERYLRQYGPAVVPANSDAVPLRAGAEAGIPRERWPEAIAAYRSAATYADERLGSVLDALEKAGVLDRLVVVATSDNGMHVGDHGRFGKSTLLESTTRVPLVIAGPGVAQPGAATSSLTELVDLYPTLVDLCGLPPVAGLDGTSLRPALLDPRRSLKDVAASMLKIGPARNGQAGRSVRSARYRYTLWPDGLEELFDYSSDPGETVNLAADASAAQTRADLRRRLEALPPVRPAPAR
jgi:iduronate 2-sulfatase